MPPTDLHLAPPSPIDEPKRLSRRIEPIYADLPIDRPADMFRLALDRTRERLGTECNIEATLLARFEAGRWIAHTGSDERLLDKLRRLSRAEHEIFLAEKTAFWKDPFPAAVWLLGGRAEWLALLRLSRPPDAGVELLLEMARLAIQQRALEAGWTSVLDRARAIQRSLLPDPLPAFAGFDPRPARNRPTPSAATSTTRSRSLQTPWA